MLTQSFLAAATLEKCRETLLDRYANLDGVLRRKADLKSILGALHGFSTLRMVYRMQS